MPRQKPFSKKTSTTYAVVHRAQNDPLIHDETAPSHVFAEVSGPSTTTNPVNHKIKQRKDLEQEFGRQNIVRDNEGEAAEHGVFYDDTSYDYMQHLRELGGGPIATGGNVTWVEARQEKRKGKAKQTLEDALRETSLEDDVYDDTQSLGGLSFATSGTSQSQVSRQGPNYQNQQDIPDAIAGFQPNMDPRLREVLEALEDEAYVDDEEDIFAELAGEGARELDQDEWEDTLFEDEEGWESDDTTKPAKEYNVDVEDDRTRQEFMQSTTSANTRPPQNSTTDIPTVIDPATATSTTTTDGDWMASFTKSKGLPSTEAPTKSTPAPQSIAPSSLMTTTTNGGVRRKKRKGALTSTTNFSMTSSALARTEPLTLLDSRFDRLADSYMNDDIMEEDEDDFDDTASMMTATTNKTGMSRMSNMSRMSSASRWSKTGSEGTQAMPAGFDSVLDEFMGGAGKKVKGRKMKKGGSEGFWGQETGMQQLDEIRKGLGAARLKTRT